MTTPALSALAATPDAGPAAPAADRAGGADYVSCANCTNCANCANCGVAREGPFCAACGQRARDGRLTLRHVARHVAGELTPVDRGLAFTVVSMLRRPGRVARAYADGATVRYTGPVKFFALLAGAAQLLALRTRFMTEMVGGVFEGAFHEGTPTVSQAAAVAFVARYFVSLSAVAVPVFALWTWLLSRRAGRNFAEHVVLALYTAGVQLLTFMLLGWLVVEPWLSNRDGMQVVLAPAYQTWALAQFAGMSAAQAAWRTLVATALTLLTVVVAIGLAVGALDAG